MGSPATPPWMSELVTRKHKIVRNMWQSSDSYFNGDEAVAGDDDHSNNEPASTSKTGGNNKKQVVEPKSTSMNVTQPHTGGRMTMAAVVEEQMHRTKAANKPKTSTEKSNPIREDGGFMEAVNPKSKQYVKNGEEESILYGPGIVKKLRSRYQSLALRQYSTRPSLRRSCSLENVLDMDASAGEGIKCDSPSPTPFEKDYTNKKTSEDNKGDDKDNDGVTLNGMVKSKSATVLEQNQNHSQMYEKKPPGPRGRAAVSERRDRMRRARSVDALTRTKHEEEILEKFKAVVLPKEEIVIIEVSKPRTNLNGLGLSNNSSYYLASAGDKTYPTQLFISPDRTTAGLTVSESGNRGARSFISPEHELPPVDIVRESVRIFEKNQENSKRVGHALRLTHSSNSSSPSSPTPQPQHPKVLTTSNAMAQPTSISDKNSTAAYNITIARPTSSVHGLKQVGIIKPTLSHPTVMAPSNLNADKSVKASESKSSVLSPILSPSQQPYKAFLQQHSSKPPLSPKPLFTSSPKPPQSPITSPVESSHPTTHGYPQQSFKLDIVSRKNGDSSLSPINIVKTPIVLNKAGPTDASKESVADRVHNVSSSKDRESPSNLRQPLKHVPNSFTINSSIREIVPASVPITHKSSPSSVSNGVKLRDISPTPTQTEPKSAKNFHQQIVDPPKVNHLNANNHERQKPHSPQPQRRTNIPPVAPPTPPRRVDESNSNGSQLRAHQKQKSNQGGNSPMVFNFTTRSSVPDYIEDDGLHKGRLTLAGTVTDESVDDIDSSTDLHLDAKLIYVVGGNVIINGKSSIQKKPKTTKMNISFNEDAITTYEYPSELSLLADEDVNEKDMLGHKGPNIINNSGNGLSSYTSKLANNDYQLGNFDATSAAKKPNATKKESETELIEDYLKPDSEDTTWSNEITADILF